MDASTTPGVVGPKTTLLRSSVTRNCSGTSSPPRRRSNAPIRDPPAASNSRVPSSAGLTDEPEDGEIVPTFGVDLKRREEHLASGSGRTCSAATSIRRVAACWRATPRWRGQRRIPDERALTAVENYLARRGRLGPGVPGEDPHRHAGSPAGRPQTPRPPDRGARRAGPDGSPPSAFRTPDRRASGEVQATSAAACSPICRRMTPVCDAARKWPGAGGTASAPPRISWPRRPGPSDAPAIGSHSVAQRSSWQDATSPPGRCQGSRAEPRTAGSRLEAAQRAALTKLSDDIPMRLLPSAARLFRQSPGSAASAIVSLALGIGANTASSA